MTRTVGSLGWSVVIPCCLTALLAVYTFRDAVACGFVFDDHLALESNRDALPGAPVSQVFLHDFWGRPFGSAESHRSYRPLTILSLRLNAWLEDVGLMPAATSPPTAHGVHPRIHYNPFGYHLVNVGLHGLVTGLITLLACRLTRRGLACTVCVPTAGTATATTTATATATATVTATATAQPGAAPCRWCDVRAGIIGAASGALFGVHPVHSESVVGVVGRADVLCAVLVLYFFLLCVPPPLAPPLAPAVHTHLNLSTRACTVWCQTRQLTLWGVVCAQVLDVCRGATACDTCHAFVVRLVSPHERNCDHDRWMLCHCGPVASINQATTLHVNCAMECGSQMGCDHLCCHSVPAGASSACINVQKPKRHLCTRGCAKRRLSRELWLDSARRKPVSLSDGCGVVAQCAVRSSQVSCTRCVAGTAERRILVRLHPCSHVSSRPTSPVLRVCHVACNVAGWLVSAWNSGCTLHGRCGSGIAHR